MNTKADRIHLAINDNLTPDAKIILLKLYDWKIIHEEAYCLLKQIYRDRLKSVY